jgi:hypothetical protein
VKQSDLQPLLTEFTADRLALLQRHEAAARAVSHYDFNNMYQYIISREETHITWLQDALAELGAPLPSPARNIPHPPPPKNTREPAGDSFRDIVVEDARQLASFIDRWRGRVDAMSHARHRTMLNVVLGESREHQRFFEQASAGMEDLLGRRTGGVPRQGAVLPNRWME